MWKVNLLLVVALLLAGCAPVSAAQAVTATQTVTVTPDPRLAGLWLDMSIEPEVVSLYNKVATDRDIARADHVSRVDLLDKVTIGRKLVVFKTVSDIEMLLPHLAGKMDIIGYNLEHGPANRPDEQADPVGSVRRVRALADQYGLELALGPDRTFALNDGVAMAPYVDIFVLQVQRAQTEPQTVRDFVLPLVKQLRQANPAMEISVQVRTEGDVKALADLLASLRAELDGVSILTSQETVPVAVDLVAELRAPRVELPAPLPQGTPAPQPVLPAKPQAQAAVLETPTAALRRTVTPVPAPVALPAAAQDDTLALRTLLLLAGIIMMGVIVTGVVATVLIYSYNNLRSR